MGERKYADLIGKRVDVTRVGGLPPYHGVLAAVSDDALFIVFDTGAEACVSPEQVVRVTLEMPEEPPKRMPPMAHHVATKRG